MVQGGEEWWYVSTASGERLVAYRASPNPRLRWTLRGLDGRVLREFVTDSATGQSWIEWDLVYRGPGGPLLAAHGTPDHRPQPETLMIHTDHLGSVRFLTDGGGHARSYHAYLPFGEEATAMHSDLLRYRFAGHERELLSPTTPTDDLDNLHARIGNPMLGRFTSTDPVQSPPGNPQGANRYAYVQGNPLTFVDPTGLTATCVGNVCSETITVTADKGNLLSELPRCDANCEFLRHVAAQAAGFGRAVEGATLAGMDAWFFGAPSALRALVEGDRGEVALEVTLALILGKLDDAAAAARGTQGVAAGKIVASNGTEITGFTRHGINRAMGDGASRAGVKPEAVLDALKNPMKIVDGIDGLGRPVQVFHGADARVVVNPQTGKIVSMNPLSAAGAARPVP